MTEVADRVAGWLRDIDLDPGATREEAILDAARSLADGLSGRGLMDLILVACNEESSGASSRAIEALREQDNSSAVREGDQVVSLTAATAIALRMEDDPEGSVPAALAVLSAEFGGLQPSVGDLPALAVASATRASEAIRARSELAARSPDIKGAFSDVAGLPDGQPATTDHLKATIKAATLASNRAVGATTRLLPLLNRRLEAADEELDLLWWIFGEYSDRADRPFKSVPLHAVACVSGVEFASHLRLGCPLPSTRALLSRALGRRADQETDLVRAVPATLKLIGHEWVPEIEGHRVLPVISSALEYTALDGKPAWKESVSRWGIPSERTTHHLSLAEQTVREVLLAVSTD